MVAPLTQLASQIPSASNQPTNVKFASVGVGNVRAAFPEVQVIDVGETLPLLGFSVTTYWINVHWAKRVMADVGVYMSPALPTSDPPVAWVYQPLKV